MTDDKDDNRDEPRTTVGRDDQRTAWSGFTVAIGQALQLAAGFPASGPLLTRKNPWLADSGGMHPPILDTAIKEILRASSRYPFWKNPRAAEAELEAVRYDIKRLKIRIASLDEDTQGFINGNGEGPFELNLDEADEAKAKAELEALEAMPEADLPPSAISRAFARLYFTPPEEDVIPVALSAIAKLDAAVVLTIEEAIEAGVSLPETGRRPNVAARDVAIVVAQYVRDVTGKLPGPRRKYSGSDFERTLAKIFELLKINADTQAPAKAALLKLGKDA